ncbi:cellulase family glycosylhydrolase [Paenibacillus sp. GCM10012307]|uniref:Cellulase family glycosylhydrolase n=1 Tax=Paenibacillus roseus TaxID=2798579 RepID=A0A934J1J8_9BACL|nr:cellulase family glycosylhydrolase [Paenibacillus roseus]MBJ6359763.1 cellulase family glycosylhydrolase [Paenibacillus roseus]
MEGNENVRGFLRADGRKLRNEAGEEVLLRGVGFGSWLLPEGYMWRFPEQGDRPRRIEKMIRDLIGQDKALQFWETYYERYVAEADIRKIAEDGFNSVRFPINARFLQTEVPGVYHEGHLALLDRVIAWCRQYRLYVILDLHGAPGGQTGTNIDDSRDNLPELFLDEAHQSETIAIWRMLAERYKDEWIVAGYDLLNEPLPNWFAEHNDKVMPLYRDIIQTIREVDDRHMIILEGVHWATDWSIFTEKPDDNLMLQFHKYWNNPDTASIQVYLDKREEWDVPLFMGEGGENNIHWYVGAFQLFEDHDISWNFWTWKKMDTDNSPCSIRKPAGWDELVAYLNGGARPTQEEAERILQDYLDHLPLEHCDYHPEVVNALLRKVPLRIPAIFYGYQGEGSGYHVGESVAHQLGFRQNDGTDIRFVHSERAIPNFQHGGGEAWSEDEKLSVRLKPDDWLAYELNLSASTDVLNIVLHVKPEASDTVLDVIVNDQHTAHLHLYGQDWVANRSQLTGAFAAGRHTLKVRVREGQAALEWINVE